MRHSHLVLVLGMHRSGTSVVARSLQCLGVELGARAEWCMPDNPRGFWEHLDIMAINETLLAQIGHRWHSVESWQNSLAACSPEQTRQLFHMALAILTTETSRAPLFGIKEPRMCRLLTFWRPIFDAIFRKISIVHVLRHPAAVTASLRRRNGLPVEKGFALWHEYTQRQFLDVDPAWPSVVVEYDDMMAEPIIQVMRIGRALGLDVDNEKLAIFERDFIDKTLWHEVSESGLTLPSEVAGFWTWAKQQTGMTEPLAEAVGG